MNKYTQWFILLILVGIADIITTYVVISHGGWEMNPYAVEIVKSPIMMVIIKLSLVVVIMTLAIISEHIKQYAGTIVVGASSLITAIVVVWNIFMAFRSYGIA